VSGIASYDPTHFIKIQFVRDRLCDRNVRPMNGIEPPTEQP
jgi:hypothetical protein